MVTDTLLGQREEKHEHICRETGGAGDFSENGFHFFVFEVDKDSGKC